MPGSAQQGPSAPGSLPPDHSASPPSSPQADSWARHDAPGGAPEPWPAASPGAPQPWPSATDATAPAGSSPSQAGQSWPASASGSAQPDNGYSAFPSSSPLTAEPWPPEPWKPEPDQQSWTPEPQQQTGQPPAPAPLDPLSAPLASLSDPRAQEPATDGSHSWSPAPSEPLSAPVQSPDSWTPSGGTGPLSPPLQPGSEPWPPEPWKPEPEPWNPEPRPAPQPGPSADFGQPSSDFGPPSPGFGSAPSDFGPTSPDFRSTSSDFGSAPSEFGPAPGPSDFGQAPGQGSLHQQSWFAQAAKPADTALSNGAPPQGTPPGGTPYDTGQPETAYNGHGAPVAPPDQWNAQEPAQPAQQSFDPESTAAWSLAEETPSGPYARPPEPAAEPTVRDAWSTQEEAPQGGESIVPDSWFAGPRAADPRTEAQGPAVWTPPPGDSEATMQVPWNAQSQAPPAGPQQFGPPPGQQQFGPPGPQQFSGPGQGAQQFGAPDQGTQQFGPPPGGQQQFGSGPAGPGWSPEPQNGWAGGPGRNETALLPDPGPGGGLPPAYQVTHLGTGPGIPDAHHPPKRSEASRSLIIAVTALVVAALAAVAFVMWPDGGSKTTTTSSPAAVKKTSKGSSAGAHQQAVAVNAILNASGTSRGELGRALASARKCDGLGSAIAGMQNVAQQRQTQISQTRALKVDGLANGARIRSTLAKAINYSLEVDKAYLAWAQASQNGCRGRPKPNADSRRGARLSAQASAAKQQFAGLWAPVAQKEGLPRRGPTSF
ncbi:hypothetical protein ACRYCC_08885 [Actinomadura scrupuli]|uniref:hypothetical protein n=1 Tax=Actinomadura scrupuli TaxID=559629 RepID=UPI003D99F6EF